MTPDCDVAVVGLGAMGAATLYQLAGRGLSVVGVDRHSPPHANGSTHGETRITRLSVGEGADYIPLVRRSHAIWRALERATGEPLFTACGGLVIGSIAEHGGTPSFLRSTIDLARRFGIMHELLDPAALAGRFPQFTGLGPDDVGYHEPGAGFVRPEACVRVQLDEAARRGARIETGTDVVAIDQAGDSVAVETSAGRIVARRAVVAAGAWTAGLLGPPFDRLLRVTRQRLFWFTPEDPSLYAPDRCPVFLRTHGERDEQFYYGFPCLDPAEGVKVADEEGDAIAPGDYRPGGADEEAADFHRRHLVNTLAGMTPMPRRSVSCLYTSTADSGFLIGARPAMPRVTVVSACSGHGFKHSAAIGELVAEHIRSGLVLAPFALPR